MADTKSTSSIAEQASATATLAAVRAPMDDYGRQIFDLWFSGAAQSEVTFDTPNWATYMQADPKLAARINYELTSYAEVIRDEVEANGGRLSRPFSRTFHGEVGDTYGGYFTGYNLLHGTDRTVGDFLISGQLAATRSGPPGSAYTVTYTALAFVFNDVVNANKRYASDITGERIATNLAKTLNVGPPRDYILHIRWRVTRPVNVPVRAFIPNRAPDFLKTFPNR